MPEVRERSSATPVPGGLVRLGPPANGDTIHRSECRHAQRPNALRWFYGEEHPEWVDVPWLKHCRVCHPENRA